MGYILKKIISIPLQPLPLILIVMIAGIILLRRRGGSGLPIHLVSAGWTLLFLGSIPAISCMLIAPLEKHFSIRHASDLSGVRWIICLGGGANKTVDMPLSAQLAQISMARATEAIILARELPDRKLVFTGKNIAQKSRRLAIALGIDSSRILTVDSAKDTEME